MKGKKLATGGKAAPLVASGNPNVIEEARTKGVTRKRGGKVERQGYMHGGAARLRLDRPGRKMGGRVGADKSPLSSAHNTSAAEKTPSPNG